MTIIRKYLEKYIREKGVLLHKERVGELSQLADRNEIVQLTILQTSDAVDSCKARIIVKGHVLLKLSTIAANEWTFNFASCEDGRLGDLFNGLLQMERR